MSFLGLEGLHVLITGAAGGIGSAAVKELLGIELGFLWFCDGAASSVKGPQGAIGTRDSSGPIVRTSTFLCQQVPWEERRFKYPCSQISHSESIRALLIVNKL
jgi:NAD(P)-dependent dehydrogenase (short-subunit alcohol dehydrogenase family)